MQAEYDSPASPRLLRLHAIPTVIVMSMVKSLWQWVVSLYPPSFVFARKTSFVPAGSILSGMEEARSSGSGKENSSTTQATDTSHKATEEKHMVLSDWNRDWYSGYFGTRMGGSWGEKHEGYISFTYSLANLTIPSAEVTEYQYVRVLIIFSKRL